MPANSRWDLIRRLRVNMVRHKSYLWLRLGFIIILNDRLLVFEGRVLRKIYGPTLDNDGTWRIKTNEN